MSQSFFFCTNLKELLLPTQNIAEVAHGIHKGCDFFHGWMVQTKIMVDGNPSFALNVFSVISIQCW